MVLSQPIDVEVSKGETFYVQIVQPSNGRRRRQIDVGMKSVPPTWRVFRMPGLVLYSYLLWAFLAGLVVGVLPLALLTR